MGSLSPTQLISLLLAGAAIAAASGFIESALRGGTSDAHPDVSFWASFAD